MQEQLVHRIDYWKQGFFVRHILTHTEEQSVRYYLGTGVLN